MLDNAAKLVQEASKNMHLTCLFRHFIVLNSIFGKIESNQKKGSSQMEHFVGADHSFSSHLKQLANEVLVSYDLLRATLTKNKANKAKQKVPSNW